MQPVHRDSFIHSNKSFTFKHAAKVTGYLWIYKKERKKNFQVIHANKLILAWLDCHRRQELIRTKQINIVVFGRIIEFAMFPLILLTPVPLIEVGRRFPLFEKLSPKEPDRPQKRQNERIKDVKTGSRHVTSSVKFARGWLRCKHAERRNEGNKTIQIDQVVPRDTIKTCFVLFYFY